jgi:hypothetical protein
VSEAKQEPVAWWVTLPGRDFPYLSHIKDRALLCQQDEPGSEVIPLYRTPHTCPYVVGRTTQHCSLTPFTLTDAEREAIYRAEARLRTAYVPDDDTAATLHSLLERTK